jgi:hypothetical protein
LNMAHNEKKRVKFRNKQDSHLWETCPACASATVVTHEPNMTLVRWDYAVCDLSTMAAQPFDRHYGFHAHNPNGHHMDCSNSNRQHGSQSPCRQ